MEYTAIYTTIFARCDILLLILNHVAEKNDI